MGGDCVLEKVPYTLAESGEKPSDVIPGGHLGSNKQYSNYLLVAEPHFVYASGRPLLYIGTSTTSKDLYCYFSYKKYFPDPDQSSIHKQRDGSYAATAVF